MTNPEVFKQLFKEARETLTNWPDWMKSEEREQSNAENSGKQKCADPKEDKRMSA